MSEQTDQLRDLIRERYAAAATMASAGAQPWCCDSTGAAIDVGEGFGAELYGDTETRRAAHRGAGRQPGMR
jgi:hypothetical protein